MLELQTDEDTRVYIRIRFFDPLDGWDIQHRFIEFAASKDKQQRRDFTMEILSYATVVFDDGREMELLTDAVIDNHLRHWSHIKTVFEEVLRTNGIDPETHANKPRFWSDAGAEMATSFIAEATKLMGPAIEMVARQNNEG